MVKVVERACRGVAMTAAAMAAIIGSVPAQASSPFDEAHQLRSLDIMLMVTSLRCRNSAHDFRADYDGFTLRQGSHLSAAQSALSHALGSASLDRMSVSIANRFGDGHPWLDCAELREVARELSQRSNAAQTAAIARWVLNPDPSLRQDRLAYDLSAVMGNESAAMP